MNDDTLTIKRSYRDREPLPVYMQYNGQNRPQPAYLQLDADGTVSVDYSGEIGNAVPARVWHGVDIRWTIPPELTVAGIDELINALAPLLAEFHDHHKVVWDGSNHVGRMDERAREIGEDIRTAHRSGLALEIRRNDEVTGYLYPVIPDHWGAGGSVVIRTDALTVLLYSDDTSIQAVEKLPFRIGRAE